MLHFKSISECNKYFGLPSPRQQMFYAVRPSEKIIEGAHQMVDLTLVKNDFYVISLKKIIKGSVHYGRTEYDCQTGTLLFVGPGQITKVNDAQFEYGGFSIMFNKEFFQGYSLFNTLSNYNFFSYATNEALHLSSKEERVLQEIYNNIESEYNNISDELSREIIISNMETLLRYSERYYNRQFRNREYHNKSLFTQFHNLLNTYADENDMMVSGPPSLQWLADELSVSKRYLRDSIKTETGKTPKEQINLFLVEQAKNLLLSPNISISKTAYKLGFKYPQYFTRLFKKVTGVNPKDYIKSKSM